jgi:hypothetical protein
MTANDFLNTAIDIARELYPTRFAVSPLDLSDEEMAKVIEELEAKTGYVRKEEYR